MSHNEMDLDRFQRLLWGFAGHRVITVAGRTGILRLLAEKVVELQITDRVSYQTVRRVLKKRFETMAGQTMVHSAGGER